MYTKQELQHITSHDKKLEARLSTAQSDEERKLIVGGGEAQNNIFRYIVALIYGSGTQMYQFCGASLIKGDTILTAAHCIADDGELYYAAIGRYKLTNVTEPGETIQIGQFHVHPEYDGNTMFGDVAVLKVREGGRSERSGAEWSEGVAQSRVSGSI